MYRRRFSEYFFIFSFHGKTYVECMAPALDSELIANRILDVILLFYFFVCLWFTAKIRAYHFIALRKLASFWKPENGASCSILNVRLLRELPSICSCHR